MSILAYGARRLTSLVAFAGAALAVACTEPRRADQA
jgi:hypothetical protein